MSGVIGLERETPKQLDDTIQGEDENIKEAVRQTRNALLKMKQALESVESSV